MRAAAAVHRIVRGCWLLFAASHWSLQIELEHVTLEQYSISIANAICQNIFSEITKTRENSGLAFAGGAVALRWYVLELPRAAELLGHPRAAALPAAHKVPLRGSGFRTSGLRMDRCVGSCTFERWLGCVANRYFEPVQTEIFRAQSGGEGVFQFGTR